MVKSWKNNHFNWRYNLPILHIFLYNQRKQNNSNVFPLSPFAFLQQNFVTL